MTRSPVGALCALGTVCAALGVALTVESEADVQAAWQHPSALPSSVPTSTVDLSVEVPYDDLTVLSEGATLVVLGTLDQDSRHEGTLTSETGEILQRVVIANLRVDEVIFRHDETLKMLGAPLTQVGDTIPISLHLEDQKAMDGVGPEDQVLVFGSWYLTDNEPALGALGGLSGFFVADQGVINHAAGADASMMAIPDGSRYAETTAQVREIANAARSAASGERRRGEAATEIVSRPLSEGDLKIDIAGGIEPWTGASVPFMITGLGADGGIVTVCGPEARNQPLERACQPGLTSEVQADGIAVLLIPPSLTTPIGKVDCTDGGCSIAAIDVATGRGTLLPVDPLGDASTQLIDGRSVPSFELDDRINPGSLQVEATTLTASRVLVTATVDAGQSSRFASSYCTTPIGETSGCDLSTGIILVPMGPTLVGGVVTVPDWCQDACRVAVVDLASQDVNGSAPIRD